MEKTVKIKSGIKNGIFSALSPKSTGEGILYGAIILMPSFVLASFQAYNTDTGHIVTSVLFGAVLGLIALLLCKGLIPSVFKGNYILKTVAMLSPAALLLSYGVKLEQSTVFYSIIFLVFFILVYIGFVTPIKDRGKHICVAIMLLLMLFAIEYSLYVYDLFSPDSFSYFDIGKTVFHDFYNVDTQRQYIVDTNLGISFPYLYPLLVAVSYELTGLQIYSGTIINIVIACISCLMLYKISVKHFKTPYPAVLAAAFMLTNDPYLTEMRVARSVPLAVLSILVLTYYILELPELKTKCAVLAGVGAGAAIVCRFDALAAAGLCLIAVFVFSRKGSRIKNTAKYTGGMLIPTAPWIIFSLLNFGKLWISDNGGTMWMPIPSIPQRYYSSGYTPQTIFNSFGEWFNQLFDYKLKYVWENGALGCFPAVIFFILLAWIAIMLVKFGCKGGIKNYICDNKRLLIGVGACVLIYIAKFCEIWIVGFSDSRYHSESFIMLILFISAVPCSMAAYSRKTSAKTKSKKKAENNYGRISASVLINAATVIACASMIAFTVSENKYLDRYTPYIIFESYLTKPASAAAIEQAVTAEKPDPVVFFCADKGDPFTFGPYTGIKTYTPPKTRFDDPNALIELTDNYIMPDYVVCSPEQLRDDFSKRYGLEQVYDYYGNYSVYKVNDKSTFAKEKKLFLND